MKPRYQRRALAARCHIPVSEVSHDINARKFSEQGRVIELDRVTGGIKFPGSMPHGLPMGADGDNACGACSGCQEQIAYNFGIDPCQGVSCQRALM